MVVFLDGPDPECVKGNSEHALAGDRTVPATSQEAEIAGPQSTACPATVVEAVDSTP
mgnify:CR=1 FL=1